MKGIKITIFLYLLLIWQMSSGQFINIKIDDLNDPNEPSVAMNPKNPDMLVAGANIYKVYTSTDGGYTWKVNNLTSTYGVWGDPCIVVDTNGFFYYFHLSNPKSGNWVDRIVCQKLTSLSGTWSDGTYTGLNGKKVQDKEWACIDRRNNNIYVAWTQFDKYQSTNPTDSTRILFSKSTDGSDSWSEPVRISRKAGDCMDGDFTAEGAMPCTGPNGEIYISWANSGVIYFDKSTDEGTTWLVNDIEVCKQPGSWDINIKGIYRSNGMPVTCCDLSNSPYRGTIYINFSMQIDGLTDADIYIVKSSDGGMTWTEPKKVNDGPAGTQQFLSWMTIDRITGYIYIVFYDRRNYNDTRTDVYLACSTDGGDTFTNTRISDSPFSPDPYVFFGDYTNIVAHNGRIVPVWTRMDNKKNSIWCSVIKDIAAQIPENREVKINNNYQFKTKIFPNPSENSFDIELFVIKEDHYSISIYDEQGKQVVELLSYSLLLKGEHKFSLKTLDFRLIDGIYQVVIRNSNAVNVDKIIIYK